MNILLVINEQKDPGYALANRVSEIVGSRARLYTLEDAEVNNVSKMSYNELKSIDIILVLGGDGTLLSIAKKASEFDIPVVGINLGRLGFLTEIEKNELENGIEKLLSGDYQIEERMMLSASLSDGKTGTALNDIVVTREISSLKILDLDVYIDDEYVDDFKADGIIISTPTGSTAYSLSAGGPIVDPSLESMIITPVCPHKMYSRTIIVPPYKSVTIKCKAEPDNRAVVAADSEILGNLSGDDTAIVKMAVKKFKLIRFKGYKFFGVLHNKLVRKEG
ncbi:MAG: NAD(+)/NADH kinase [Clostridia bacterium]|nr:NAD(+)/NADH kinase [Clostridia bacterium]